MRQLPVCASTDAMLSRLHPDSWAGYFVGTIGCGFVKTDYRSYSKGKLEFEFNLSELLPVNCKFFRCSIPI